MDPLRKVFPDADWSRLGFGFVGSSVSKGSTRIRPVYATGLPYVWYENHRAKRVGLWRASDPFLNGVGTIYLQFFGLGWVLYLPYIHSLPGDRLST